MTHCALSQNIIAMNRRRLLSFHILMGLDEQVKHWQKSKEHSQKRSRQNNREWMGWEMSTHLFNVKESLRKTLWMTRTWMNLVSGCIKNFFSLHNLRTCLCIAKAMLSINMKKNFKLLWLQLLLQIHTLQSGKKSHHTSTLRFPLAITAYGYLIREKLRLYHLVTSDIPPVTMNLHNDLPKPINAGYWLTKQVIGSIRKYGIVSPKPSASRKRLSSPACKIHSSGHGRTSNL